MPVNLPFLIKRRRYYTLYPLWNAVPFTDIQLLKTVGISDPGSFMPTSLENTGQFFQFSAIFEPQHR